MPVTSFERADACLAALDDAGRAIARRVFLRLVGLGETGAGASRSQPLAALRAGDDPDRLADTLRRLSEARLLRIEGDPASGPAEIELADAALLAWPALQGWIRSHGAAEQRRRGLETDAAEWSQRAEDGRGDAGLLDRRQLAELAGWLSADARRDLGVSPVAESYIAASRAARGRWWPGRSSVGGGLAILVILLILATPITLLSIVGLTAALIHRTLG